MENITAAAEAIVVSAATTDSLFTGTVFVVDIVTLVFFVILVLLSSCFLFMMRTATRSSSLGLMLWSIFAVCLAQALFRMANLTRALCFIREDSSGPTPVLYGYWLVYGLASAISVESLGTLFNTRSAWVQRIAGIAFFSGFIYYLASVSSISSGRWVLFSQGTFLSVVWMMLLLLRTHRESTALSIAIILTLKIISIAYALTFSLGHSMGKMLTVSVEWVILGVLDMIRWGVLPFCVLLIYDRPEGAVVVPPPRHHHHHHSRSLDVDN